ncbi:RNA polymerase sigma factor SigX [Metabacillus iocasae]|uniref:RNA polymerase sigma factor n=1 Tax=Priestia iocasae TaxID=2291674 RepID=A0ABS2QQF3_9BACI|nr:RNA polymerase sigma factor SigX [Metabacillus iocasae]MBM7701683.1 RNA polymerase sigma-70 factor (ECF subfamily) [Metabacillus iocasae]
MNPAFDHLYEEYHQDVFQFLVYMVRDRSQAEDLVQEVYIRVFKSYDRFEGKSHEKTWLFSIARNVAIDFLRKQTSWKKRVMNMFDWTSNQLADYKPLPEEIAIQSEQVAMMYQCLDTCTVDQRSVIILRYIQSLSIHETATILGWTESKVKTTQHRAIHALRKEMENLSKKEGDNNEPRKMERKTN